MEEKDKRERGKGGMKDEEGYGRGEVMEDWKDKGVEGETKGDDGRCEGEKEEDEGR